MSDLTWDCIIVFMFGVCVALFVWFNVLFFQRMQYLNRPPAQGSVSLCETGERFHPDGQKAWDFWMGPYEFVPCKWLTEKKDV